MEATGSLTTHMDKSQDLTMGLTNGVVSGNAFVNGYKTGDPNAPKRPTGDSFAAAGGNLGVQRGPIGASVQATHIPSFGNQVTTAANATLLNHNDHKVTANAYQTHNMPHKGPNYTVQGAGVNYQFKETVGIGASTAHIPINNMHQHSVSSKINLHNTPTSSLDFNFGVTQTTSPFRRGNWKRDGVLTFRKQF